MRDPFKPNSNKQLVREAQFGFTVIGLLVAMLIYVAWFRLNGEDATPEHIRSAPVAMQVFPSSPNYDRETHTMRSPEQNAFAASSIKPTQNASTSVPVTPPQTEKSNPAFVSVPKKIMDESNRTARSLQNAAESIEQTASRVATLTSPPKTKKPFGLVSNPAANSASDSGFKILKKPELDSGPTNLSGKALSAGSLPKTNTAPFPKPPSTTSRFNTGNRLGQPAVKTPVLSKPNDFKTATTEASNGFKPNITTPFSGLLPPQSKLPKIVPPKVEPEKIVQPEKTEPLKIEPSKPFSTFGQPQKSAEPDAAEPDAAIPRLPKLPEQSLNDLRSPETSSEPEIKTVAFENATWDVKKGDSFWSIAQSNYGDGRFFRALYEQNRRSVPGFENLTEGVSLELPTADQLVKRYPDLCPSDAVRKNDPWRGTPDDLMEELTDGCEHDLDRRLYETKPGDTLFKVARRQLGQASRYVELIELNEFRLDSNVTHESELPSGIQLLLPKE